MNQDQKYEAICQLKSIGASTGDTYPNKTEFTTALRENRVSGNYNHHITIVANHARKQYIFVKRSTKECCKPHDKRREVT